MTDAIHAKGVGVASEPKPPLRARWGSIRRGEKLAELSCRPPLRGGLCRESRATIIAAGGRVKPLRQPGAPGELQGVVGYRPRFDQGRARASVQLERGCP